MKKLFLITLVIVASTLISIAQKVYNIPDKGDALVEITIPTDKWEVTNDDGLFSIVPNDTGETARLITMIWASEDPTSETAIDDLANEAFDVVESLLVDIEWAEDITDFENNGITFVANDGYGYYVNED